MSTLTSASTMAQVQAAYDDNASYAEDSSVAKCKAFITACRFLLRRMPTKASHGGSQGDELELDVQLIQKEKIAAEQWLAGQESADGGSGGIVHADLSGFRS